MDTSSPELAAFARARLEPLRRLSRGRARASPADHRRALRRIHELQMFVCAAGSPQNLYSRAGLPQTHAAWEMQLLIDGGLLFWLDHQCRAAVRDSPDAAALAGRIDALLGTAALLRGPQLREHYAGAIEARLRAPPPSLHPRLALELECAVVRTYLALAARTPGAMLTLDLFPAHTGARNVVEGLKGLVPLSARRINHRGARAFFSCRAETYTRYYGLNVAKLLTRALGLRRRFGLVIPYANNVRHIALTRCWPIDGAENAARYLAAVGEALEPEAAGPTVLVSGYSQGGAAVRLLDDALAGLDVTTQPEFRRSGLRGYARRCSSLRRLIARPGARARRRPTLYTLSVATMGGVDGEALVSERRGLRDLAGDARGAAGIRSHTNGHGGVHVAVCHDFDPARWIVPSPLRPRSPKPSLLRTLLRFGGPAQVFHGGTWTRDTHEVFAHNPAAMALLREVEADMISERFVDEHGYFDERCVHAAFVHLVVGTIGYPGWEIVSTYAAALEALAAQTEPIPAGRRPLLDEPSWRRDILPEREGYAAIVTEARRIHERLRDQARARLAQLEASGGGTPALRARLQRRAAAETARRHLLRQELRQDAGRE